jgi:hypothetical protein
MTSFPALRLLPKALALCGAVLVAPVQAQSVYAGVGSTGLIAGYVQHYGDALGARAELSVLPSVGRSFTEDGIRYTGEARSTRGAVVGDWHPLRGVFRLSAGLSMGNTLGTFTGAPVSGSSITIGSATVAVGPGDRYDVRAEMPSVMPYVGLGWGLTPARGWGVHADIGALIGTPTVNGSLSDSLAAKIALTGSNPQAELDRELQTVRDTAGKIRAVPVISFGASYRW